MARHCALRCDATRFQSIYAICTVHTMLYSIGDRSLGKNKFNPPHKALYTIGIGLKLNKKKTTLPEIKTTLLSSSLISVHRHCVLQSTTCTQYKHTNKKRLANLVWPHKNLDNRFRHKTYVYINYTKKTYANRSTFNIIFAMYKYFASTQISYNKTCNASRRSFIYIYIMFDL